MELVINNEDHNISLAIELKLINLVVEGIKDEEHCQKKQELQLATCEKGKLEAHKLSLSSPILDGPMLISARRHRASPISFTTFLEKISDCDPSRHDTAELIA
jgi:hypothetical protein